MRTLCLWGALGVLFTACAPAELPAAPSPEALADRSFALAFDDERVSPSHSLDVLQELMGVDALLLKTRVQDGQIDFFAGLGIDDGGLGQMACIEAEVWDGLDFTAPEIRSSQGDELTFNVAFGEEVFPIELLDARMIGTFSEDGTTFEELYIDAYWDVTAIDGLVEGDGCDVLPALGLQCGPCPGGGETCITASLDAQVIASDPGLAFDPAYVPANDPVCR